MNPVLIWVRTIGRAKETGAMGTIIEFPAGSVARRAGPSEYTPAATATVIILPVIRIERHTDETSGGQGPEEGAAPGRRRRRRARS